MAAESYDLIVIGSGPGGYVCAIRAAQLGLRTACVEARETLGGTCLNIGCIPSKALLQASEKFEEAQHALAGFGVKVEGVALDLAAMMAHKDKVVESNVKGIEFLFKKHKIDWLKGRGQLKGQGVVAVGDKDYQAKSIVIATGSTHIDLPNVTVDEKRIVSSTGALSLERVPETMVVIGGGYIGLELGSVWQRLGAKVTVVEFLDRLVPGMDGEIARQFQRVLGKQGMAFKLSSKVTAAKADESGVTLTVQPAKGEAAAEELRAEVVLVAVGRRPMTEGLGVEAAGVALDERGRVKVDAHLKTTAAGIHAIGDVIVGPMLAHKAEEEGIAVAEMLAGQSGHVNYETVPGIVYTWPEVATVGKTEEQLKEAGIGYKVGKFPFTANARARAMAATDGFVKILADAKTDRILGAHIMGPDAGTLIHEVVVCMEFGGSAEDLARSFHGHPTLNEAVKEAALAVDKRPIHI
ncbi:MAG TPA: dihydrolipoyl dehydrogenase [Kiloniellales bacterium]|nr:dihydrolipoyl dehydrogenase [Kiloniellales bacterium]